MVGYAGFQAVLCATVAVAAALPGAAQAQEPEAVTLPAGVRAVWDAGKAVHEATATRERICINGLWEWQPCVPRPQDAGQPMGGKDAAVPDGHWGYFKVPGSWPGTTDYMQKDCQTVFAHPAWQDTRIRDLAAAWYQRSIDVPSGWAGRRILLRLEYLNSFAVVYLDGKAVGELRFPGGALDLTNAVHPGRTHRLSLAVTAMSQKAVRMSYADSARAKEVKSEVQRRGLCGDAWLESGPVAERIGSVAVATSVRRGELTVTAGLDELGAKGAYVLRARILDHGKVVRTFASPSFTAAHCTDGRYAFTERWHPDRLWDLQTPGNMFELEVALESHGRVKDRALPERFGFRELWIDGRDFIFNGTRLFVSAVPVDNANIGAGAASEAGARETFQRLKAIGINAVYSHNYGTEPGSHLDMSGVLQAADAEGMLVFFAQPHFGEYEWKGEEADRSNGYAGDAAYFTRIAGNHPSVVLYAMSHNGCGYGEDMNPDLLGTGTVERDEWSDRNAKRALRAEAIVRRLDPSRIVYHHAGGDLGSMHTVNYYANFSPIQEQADWLESWATKGVKPLFLCEWGAPLSWDWTMYRGWYKGAREFGSGEVPWEFCHAEWNAQFVGDRAFALGEPEQRNLRWEAEKFRNGKLWHRWDYPSFVGSNKIEGWDEVVARSLTATLRANRAWGLSAWCIWDHGAYWVARDGVPAGRRELPVDWDQLQQPGFSADYVDEVFDRFDVAYEPSDWTPTAAGRAILRSNGPRLGFIAGGPAAFTAKDHACSPGATLEKQLIVINNSRATETCAWSWTLAAGAGPALLTGSGALTQPTGEIAKVPVHLPIPEAMTPGTYYLTAGFRFGNGLTQQDAFAVEILAPAPLPASSARIAIFDPEGDTTKRLAGLGVTGEPVGAEASLAGFDVLVIGRRALSPDGPAPDLARVRDGLRVVIFEQSVETLERRLGFRATEYGLRQVFPRIPDHPLLSGLEESVLHDWSGEATLVPPRRTYTMEPMHGPMIDWCGLKVSRAWRCGNRGNVASVLIEKPARGDFLPLLDGGFSDQYAPLMAYREGKGLVLFCQLDVTGRIDRPAEGGAGRTAPEPAADRLVRNLVAYAASGWKPVARRAPKIVTTTAGQAYLKTLGVVSSGSGPVLALGVDAAQARSLPGHPALHRAEHIATVFAPPAAASPFAGVAPADVMNRDAGTLNLVSGGADPLGDGVLAASGTVTLCQLVPWEFPYGNNYGHKRTFRRAAVLVNRVLANAGAAIPTPLLARVHTPPAMDERRWLEGFYMDQPEEWDDPYRFFRW